MAFSVVQTRKTKKSKPSLTIVPSTWAESGHVLWPPSNFISLSTDEYSIPDSNTWLKQPCKVVGRAKSYREAEDIVNRLEMVTDSEDAVNMMQGTRGRPAKKKPKFEAKFYNLTPPQIKPSLVMLNIFCYYNCSTLSNFRGIRRMSMIKEERLFL